MKKIMCIGGGPAGLYFAISAKLRDAGHDITVIERDPAARSSMPGSNTLTATSTTMP